MEIIMIYTKNNGLRLRQFILGEKVFEKFFKVFSNQNKMLCVSAVKFVKTIVNSKDEILVNYLIDKRLIDILLNHYFKCAKKKNLINSVYLELFENIAQTNIKRLVRYLSENFRLKIISSNVEKYFEKIFIKYEQANDMTQPLEISVINSNDKAHEIMEKMIEEKEDEEYFSQDDNSNASDDQIKHESDFSEIDNLNNEKKLAKMKENLLKKKKLKEEKDEKMFTNQFEMEKKKNISIQINLSSISLEKNEENILEKRKFLYENHQNESLDKKRKKEN